MLDEEVMVRQMAEDEILQCVSELNRRYEANDFNGIKYSERNYKVVVGQIPILVSAPHAVRQLRDGEMKERDGMTGGLAEYLCGKFGVWGVVRTWNADDDPNYGEDEQSEMYRKAMANLVREQGIGWVIDLHGCLNKYGFDMDIGVNGGENLACGLDEMDRIVQCWRELGLDVHVDRRFRAHRMQAVSNYVHCATGVNCLQMELSSRLRTTGVGLRNFCAGFEKTIMLHMS